MQVDVSDSGRRHVQSSAENLLTHTIVAANSLAPDVEVTGEAVDGSAAQILIDASAHATLLVLGSRRLKALGSALLGSVGTGVAARACCPVVVVRGPAGLTAERAAVVVGVDGTDAAEPALEFGFDHASRHHVPLRAVLCWRPDVLAAMQWRPEPPAPDRAEQWLSEALAGWLERYPDVPARGVVVRDHPVTGLVAASHAQRLLVVRSRTRHALAGTLLGSVSQGVLHHATCPVAVIPAASS
jgi:nucleotide-binding universal stress UspA family protein